MRANKYLVEGICNSYNGYIKYLNRAYSVEDLTEEEEEARGKLEMAWEWGFMAYMGVIMPYFRNMTEFLRENRGDFLSDEEKEEIKREKEETARKAEEFWAKFDSGEYKSELEELLNSE